MCHLQAILLSLCRPKLEALIIVSFGTLRPHLLISNLYAALDLLALLLHRDPLAIRPLSVGIIIVSLNISLRTMR